MQRSASIFVFTALFGFAQTALAAELRVAAAADLKFALDEIATAYHSGHPEVLLKPTYGSSGNFYSQISNGAPFDLFFSADVDYARKLVEQGLVLDGVVAPYAVGRIVLWVPSSAAIDLDKLQMRALLDPSVRKIAIANPQHAPYGRAAEAALKSQGLYAQVQGKLVFGENISQAAQFVQSGAAEAGILAMSLALAPALRQEGQFWEIPQEAYPRLEQGAVILKSAQDPAAARSFLDFVLGPAGQDLMKRYGFLVP